MAERENGQDTRTMVLMVLITLWLAAWGASLYFLLLVPPSAQVQIPGVGRLSGFFGWQGVASMFAFGAWGVGWSYEKGSGIRRVAAVPLLLAVALVLVLLGMWLFG